MSIEKPTVEQIAFAVHCGRPIEKIRDEDGVVVGLRIVELQGYSPAQNARWFGDGIARHILSRREPER
jgi:hypothetical protein